MFEYFLYYPNYRLRDYEAKLAQKEVIAITGEMPEQIDGGLRLISQVSFNTDILQRLTFFHRIEVRNSSTQWSGLTYQTLLENTAKIARKVENPDQVSRVLNQITQPMNGRKESQHV